MESGQSVRRLTVPTTRSADRDFPVDGTSLILTWQWTLLTIFTFHRSKGETGRDGGDRDSVAKPHKILDKGRNPRRRELRNFPNRFALRGGTRIEKMRNRSESRFEKRKTTSKQSTTTFDLKQLTAVEESKMYLGDVKP